MLRHLLSSDSDPRDSNRLHAHTTIHPTVSPSAPTVEVTSVSFLSSYTVYFIAVPLVTILVVALVSLVIHLLVRRHRNLYSHQLVFHYDPQDESGWESELLDDTDPPFVRDNHRPIVRGTLNIEPNSNSNGKLGHVVRTWEFQCCLRVDYRITLILLWVWKCCATDVWVRAAVWWQVIL